MTDVTQPNRQAPSEQDLRDEDLASLEWRFVNGVLGMISIDPGTGFLTAICFVSFEARRADDRLVVHFDVEAHAEFTSNPFARQPRAHVDLDDWLPEPSFEHGGIDIRRAALDSDEECELATRKPTELPQLLDRLLSGPALENHVLTRVAVEPHYEEDEDAA